VRARDLTPTKSSAFERSGGGDAFLAFIRNELLPWVGTRSSRCLADTTYFGHSLGGLFGTHVLLSKPETFRRYVISSPSLWWDHRVMFDRIDDWSSTHDDLTADVYFGIGSEETDPGRRREAANLPHGHPAKSPEIHLDMVDDLLRFVQSLRDHAYPSLALESVVFTYQYHSTVPATVLSHGLRHFYLAS
jgi:pimeloyl-ACP methyl ester carboxylesterase